MAMRVAVVGLAGMGGTHVRLASRMETYELTAVCDIVPETLDRVATATGAKPFSSTDELFASGVADAVVIATPPVLHLAQVRAALDAGLHVYCEKPMTCTVDEADELAAAAEASGRAVQVGFQHRFQHSFATAKEIIDRGEVGGVFRANLTSTNWFRPQAYFDARPWRGRWTAAGGGVLMNQAIHHVDAYLWMVGMPTRVTAHAWCARHRAEVEDDVLATLEFAGGGRGMIVASTTDPIGTDRLEVHGELGSLVASGRTLRFGKLPQGAQEISDTCPDAFPHVEVAWHDIEPDGKPVTFNEFVSANHADFQDAAAAGRPGRNNPREAARAIELAGAIYLSACRGEPVGVPLDRVAYRDLYAKLCAGEVGLATTPGEG